MFFCISDPPEVILCWSHDSVLVCVEAPVVGIPEVSRALQMGLCHAQRSRQERVVVPCRHLGLS